MPDPAQPTDWPTAKFSFVIDIAGVATSVPFQEVSGLDIESQLIEYRHGTSPTFATIKMPGMQKSANVVLKRGVFAKDNKLFDWLESVKHNAAKRSTITIKLLDESGNPTMTWTLANAWPEKISATDLKSTGNEVAVESIELAHEGVTIDSK